MAGGRIWPLEQVRGSSPSPARHGLRTHLDGARLLNAVVASGVRAATGPSGFDTAWIDFTKGLGAPVGACLAGSARADRGGLALQADVGRRDAPGGRHRRRRALRARPPRRAPGRRPRATRARSPRGSPSSRACAIDPATVETNIVIFEVGDAPGFWRGAGGRGRRRGRARRRAACARSPTSTSTRRDRAGARAAVARRPAASALRVCPCARADRVPHLSLLRGDLRPRDHARGRRGARVRGDADDVFSHGFICPKGVSAQGAARGPRPAAHPADAPRRRLRRGELGRGVRGDRPRPRADPGRAAAATRVAAYLGNPNAHNLAHCSTAARSSRRSARKNVYSACTVDQMPKQVGLGADVRHRRCACRSPTSTAPTTC